MNKLKGSKRKSLSFCRTTPPLATSETSTRGVRAHGTHTRTFARAVHNQRSISRSLCGTHLLLQS